MLAARPVSQSRDSRFPSDCLNDKRKRRGSSLVPPLTKVTVPVNSTALSSGSVLFTERDAAVLERFFDGCADSRGTFRFEEDAMSSPSHGSATAATWLTARCGIRLCRPTCELQCRVRQLKRTCIRSAASVSSSSSAAAALPNHSKASSVRPARSSMSAYAYQRPTDHS